MIMSYISFLLQHQMLQGSRCAHFKAFHTQHCSNIPTYPYIWELSSFMKFSANQRRKASIFHSAPCFWGHWTVCLDELPVHSALIVPRVLVVDAILLARAEHACFAHDSGAAPILTLKGGKKTADGLSYTAKFPT